jgi:hypothetical protein
MGVHTTMKLSLCSSNPHISDASSTITRISTAALLVTFWIIGANTVCEALVIPSGLRHVISVGSSASSPSSSSSKRFSTGRMSSDLGLPCEEECALECFPNLPLSVHPGVVTGQALLDLINHAKENGKKNECKANKK